MEMFKDEFGSADGVFANDLPIVYVDELPPNLDLAVMEQDGVTVFNSKTLELKTWSNATIWPNNGQYKQVWFR